MLPLCFGLPRFPFLAECRTASEAGWFRSPPFCCSSRTSISVGSNSLKRHGGSCNSPICAWIAVRPRGNVEDAASFRCSAVFGLACSCRPRIPGAISDPGIPMYGTTFLIKHASERFHNLLFLVLFPSSVVSHPCLSTCCACCWHAPGPCAQWFDDCCCLPPAANCSACESM